MLDKFANLNDENLNPMDEILLEEQLMNSLLEEQRALNMRLLLAVQIRDLETQTSLRQELEENAAQIDRLLTGRM